MNEPGRMRVQTIGVLGGGSAGYLAALALRARLPEIRTTLIESSLIPIIGVGEGTTPLMVPFLHSYLGFDPHDFHEEVRPTWKLGVRLFWGIEGDYAFNFPFDGRFLVESYAYTGDINACSVGSLLMTGGAGPVIQHSDWSYESLLKYIPVAYHLDNQRFVNYLKRQSARLGLESVDAQIADVEVGVDGSVTSLVAADGRRFSFDLYIDCSGFRSRLLGDALGSPFRSYTSSLFTDSAFAAPAPRNGRYGSYTLAMSMDNGWCWSIPMPESDHRGYVFSSAFVSPDEALDEMRRKNPTMGEPRLVQFRPGRHEHWWKGNVVGIGNAFGFVEPLEATALHMVVREITNVITCLQNGTVDARTQDQLNGMIGEAWDYICGHLALHYKFNRKFDTPFWRACRERVDLVSLEGMVAEALERGPLVGRRQSRIDDPSYALDNIADETDLLLLGQKVLPNDLVVPRESREQWGERLTRFEAWTRRALSSNGSLSMCLRYPDLCEFSEARWYRILLSGLEIPKASRAARL